MFVCLFVADMKISTVGNKRVQSGEKRRIPYTVGKDRTHNEWRRRKKGNWDCHEDA